MLSCNSLPNLVNLIVLASHCYHMLQWSGDSDHKLFSQYKTLHRTYENGSYDVPSINTNALRPTHWSLKDKGNEVRSPDNPIIWLYGKRVYLSNSVARWWRKAWCLHTRGFILKKIQWHIHTGSWSLVNCWREVLMRHYIRCSWILMRAAVGLMEWPRPW